MIKVTRRCLRALDMWKKPWFLSQGPVLGAPCRRVTLATDASLTVWGAVMDGHPAHGLWSSRHLTLNQSRAPSMRKLYALKWKLFTSWCGHHQQDPLNCPVGTVLEYLQDRLSAGLADSTLRVYVAAISAYHAPLGGMSV
ncbi:hypothetical protein M9458_009307, partial [Cirrhinus mrigala]